MPASRARSGDGDAHRAAARAHGCPARRDLREGLGQPDDHARYAAVAHDQVGADAHRQHRARPGRARPRKLARSSTSFGSDQPFGRAAGGNQMKRRASGAFVGRPGRQRGTRRGTAPPRSCGVPRASAVAMASARPAAHLVMSPAPRQIDHVAAARRGRQAGGERRRVGDVLRRGGRAASAPRPGLGIDALDRLLAGRHRRVRRDDVGIVEGALEFLHQVAQPGVAVRLDDRDHPPFGALRARPRARRAISTG